MGVFNGNSIYNDGGAGGGGGYNDGGSLTPADYIELENNSFYKLEGNDAAYLNFVIDGESGVLNSIVEVSTNVNSLVSVYVDKNGILYLLSCLDPNIEGGKSYKITIQGDSFFIEEVQSVGLVPSKAKIDGIYRNVYEFNDLLITEDLGDWFNYIEFQSLISRNPDWEIITKNDVDQIVNDYGIDAIRSTSGWTYGNGTNSTGLNFEPLGYIGYGSYIDVGKKSFFWGRSIADGNYISIWYDSVSTSTFYTEDGQIKLRARLKKVL